MERLDSVKHCIQARDSDMSLLERQKNMVLVARRREQPPNLDPSGELLRVSLERHDDPRIPLRSMFPNSS